LQIKNKTATFINKFFMLTAVNKQLLKDIILGQDINVCLTNTSRSSFQLLAFG